LLNDNAFGPKAPSTGLNFAKTFGGKGNSVNRRSMSHGSLEIQEVRALSLKEFYGQEEGPPRTPHETLMSRLKSRSARMEAESNKLFLDSYRSATVSSAASDSRLDTLLKATQERSEELRLKSEELQTEVADAERRLERANNCNAVRASEQELQAMNAFERSQRKIQEDKREEELQHQRDEAQASYAKMHRRLQSELIELRDYKVLLREFRRMRLEKLQEALLRVEDGRKLRSCVREMIRHGAQRILQRLDQAEVPLEPWMREVLVNSCHIEMRIEDKEGQLLNLRRQALGSVKADVQAMCSQTKQERFDRLMESFKGDANRHARNADHTAGEGGEGGDGMAHSLPTLRADATPAARARRVPEDIATQMTMAEADIAAMRRLLNDMRQNAAAAICNSIRQAEKSGVPEVGREASHWGTRVLTLLVSEDFAKATMKELQRSAPHKQFVD